MKYVKVPISMGLVLLTLATQKEGTVFGN